MSFTISPFLRSLVGPTLLVLIALLFRQWYMTPDLDQGELAADFSATLYDGEPFRLRELRGRFVLLHFWGSWCGPCRQQNPSLARELRRWEGELVPVSIAIDRDSSRWRDAIHKDGLYWPHHIMDPTSNLRFLNGPISDLYGVNQVPTEFLIDPEGKIIALNPPLATLGQLMENAR